MNSPTLCHNTFIEKNGKSSSVFLISGIPRMEDPIVKKGPEELVRIVLALKSAYPEIQFENRIPYASDPRTEALVVTYPDGCANSYRGLKQKEIPPEIRPFVSDLMEQTQTY